jgi:hypothetical protein
MIYKYRNITNLPKIYNTVGMHMNSIFTGFDYMNKKSLKIPREVIRIRISRKNRQCNGQKKKYKRTNNDLQNIHIKLKIE